VVGVPYTALTPELTADYDERTSLNTYRFGFSILGGVLAAFFHSQIVAAFAPNRALGAAISVGFWAVLSTLGLWWTFLGTRGYAERPSSATPNARRAHPRRSGSSRGCVRPLPIAPFGLSR